MSEFNAIWADEANEIYKESGIFFYCEDGQAKYALEEETKKETFVRRS